MLIVYEQEYEEKMRRYEEEAIKEEPKNDNRFEWIDNLRVIDSSSEEVMTQMKIWSCVNSYNQKLKNARIYNFDSPRKRKMYAM